MISSENAKMVIMEGKFPCAVCRKGVVINSILCQFCRCWVHKGCSGIRGKLKEDSKFKCQTYANQQTGIAEDCCFGDTIRVRRGVFDSVITRIRNGW